MSVLVTGAAGFIGFHLAAALARQGHQVVGIDNVNDYYDPRLKLARLDMLGAIDGFSFVRMDIADRDAMAELFSKQRFRYVVNLAAQAGVRHSLTHPHDYVSANITGFLNVLEGCRHTGVEHLVYASSSSVYGANTAMPFATTDGVNHPLSMYAATKRSNELMAHTYSHLFGVPATGLRFFTVYGPWGRPDMAMYIFASAIFAGKPIHVFNGGDMQRDFTYVDDIVGGIARLLDKPPEPQARPAEMSFGPNESFAPFRLFNIGNNRPTELLRVIDILEEQLGRKAVRIMEPMQPGDVKATWADVDDLAELTGFRPSTPIEEGIARFVDWYKRYHNGPATESTNAFEDPSELAGRISPRRTTLIRIAEYLPRFAFYALLCYSAFSIWQSLEGSERTAGAWQLAVASAAAVVATLAWRLSYIRSLAFLISFAMLLPMLLSSLSHTRATMSSGRYVGMQLGAGDFLDALRGARLIYGRDGVSWFRVLTDRPFLNALSIAVIEDGAAMGIELNLTPEQFQTLSQHAAIDFWYGGYHFRLFPSAAGNRTERFVLVLPPGPFDNLGLMVAADLYEEVTR